MSLISKSPLFKIQVSDRLHYSAIDYILLYSCLYILCVIAVIALKICIFEEESRVIESFEKNFKVTIARV